MTVEIISWSNSTKVWDRAGIELATPGSAVRHAAVARHVTDCGDVTDCATRPGTLPRKLDNKRHSPCILYVREKVGKGGSSDNGGTLVKSA